VAAALRAALAWSCLMSPHELDIRYVAGFIADPDTLFRTASHELEWDRRMAARRTASSGTAYNYSGNSYPDVAMGEFLLDMVERISRFVGHPITNCLANLYETSDSRMGFHSDSAAGIAPGSSTAIVSLGGTRDLVFRPKSMPEPKRAVTLHPGSLLVMGASVQDHWLHAVPPAAGGLPRISLTFRHILRESRPHPKQRATLDPPER